MAKEKKNNNNSNNKKHVSFNSVLASEALLLVQLKYSPKSFFSHLETKHVMNGPLASIS